MGDPKAVVGGVDDGGVDVVYVQLDGESFARREIRVLVRQGAGQGRNRTAVADRAETVQGGCHLAGETAVTHHASGDDAKAGNRDCRRPAKRSGAA